MTFLIDIFSKITIYENKKRQQIISLELIYMCAT